MEKSTLSLETFLNLMLSSSGTVVADYQKPLLKALGRCSSSEDVRRMCSQMTPRSHLRYGPHSRWARASRMR